MGGAAVSGALEQMMPTDTASQELIKDLGKKLSKLNKNYHFLMKNRDQEEICVLEKQHTLAKQHLEEDLQRVLETTSIRY